MPRTKIRKIIGITLAVSIVFVTTIAGMGVGLIVGSKSKQETSLATMDTEVIPALHGDVTVYVPLVDWKVQLPDHKVPVKLLIEVRGIDRASAGTSISSRVAARRSLAKFRSESKVVVKHAVVRGLIAAAIGGVLGGLFGGALVGAILHRRRWILIGTIIGVVVTSVSVASSAHELSGLESRSVGFDSAAGTSGELPQVLQFARQLLVVGDEYEQHYETALSSIKSITDFTSKDSPNTKKLKTAFLISDIHDNVFVLEAFRRLAQINPVFAVGDFGQVGARVEERLSPKIASLGGGVIAVSGNHDSEKFMDSLKKDGVTVLDGDLKSKDPSTAETTLNGLTIAGYRDPLERRKAKHPGAHLLRVYGYKYDRQVKDFLTWFDSLPQRPDIVLVHQHGFAHKLADHLREQRKFSKPITILTGHDHQAHVESYEKGRIVIVDGGTLGAGGPFAVGEQEASFAQIGFDKNRVVEVTIISIDPIDGTANSRRIEISNKARVQRATIKYDTTSSK